MPLPLQTPPDDSQVLLPAPLWSPPLLQHHQGLSVEDEAAQEEDDRGYEHDPQAISHVVLGQAGAAEVNAGIHLYTCQGQQPTDPVHYRLRVGLEILEDHPETVHRVLLARGAPPEKSLGCPEWPVSLCPSSCCHRAGDAAQPPVSRRMRMEESCRGRGNTLCWGFPTGTQLSQICLSPNACLPGQLVAFLGELMHTASSSFFFHLVFHFQGCPTCQPVTASSSAGSLPPGDGNSVWRAIGGCLRAALSAD